MPTVSIQCELVILASTVQNVAQLPLKASDAPGALFLSG